MIWRGLLLLWMTVSMVAAFTWAPLVPGLEETTRVLYFHIPAAWLSVVGLGWSMVHSLLYLGRRRNAYVMGLELAESERVLEELWSFVETTVYRHRWALGDLVLWDNRTTMHRRDAFHPKARARSA